MVEINETKHSSTNSINPIVEKHVDLGTGRTYLYNAATGETRWEEDGSTSATGHCHVYGATTSITAITLNNTHIHF